MRQWVRELGERCVSTRVQKRMTELEPYKTEGVVISCNLWAAYVLAKPPSNFISFPAAFRLAERLTRDESVWASWILLAGLLGLFGLATLAIRGPLVRELSFAIRCVALGMSAAFWLLMGTSAFLGNPDTLFGVPAGMALGVSCLWVLIRLPSTTWEDS